MAPYLTFVVAARNDDYGGNFLHRTQVFADALSALWEKHGLNGELIIVEWNPPEDRPRLKDALTWPEGQKPGLIRIIEVPSEIHQRLPNSDRMPIFEYIAKNVGIRRAEGEYVLATNPDLLYSDELIRLFATRCLRLDRFYRVDRYDVSAPVPLGIPVEQQLQFCRSHSVRVARASGTVAIGTRRYPDPLKLVRSIPRIILQAGRPTLESYGRSLHTNAAGDFFVMAHAHWHELRGYPELKSHSFIDGYILFMAASLGLRQVALKDPHRIYHQEHDRSEHEKRPLTDYQLYLEQSRRMMRSNTPEILNDANWGLGGETLREFRANL